MDSIGKTVEWVSGDMRLLDWFATFAPEPSKELIDVERLKDRNRARHNDSFTLRDDVQIQCELRYKWAEGMMKARERYK